MSNIRVVSEIDFSKIKHGPKKARGKGESCFVSYGSSKEFTIQGPKMRVPFGLSEPHPDFKKPGEDKFSIELSLNDDEKYDKNGRVAEFKKFVDKLEELNVQYISECSEDWWGESYDPAMVRKIAYNSMIKQPTKDKSGKPLKIIYPPRMRIKLPFYKGIPQFKVFDGKTKQEIVFAKADGDNVSLDWSKWIERGKALDVVPIIQNDGLWIIGGGNGKPGRVYNGFKAVGLRVYNNSSTKVTEESFRDFDDDEDNEEDGDVDAVTDDFAEGAQIEEEEEEEEEDDDGIDPEEEEEDDE